MARVCALISAAALSNDAILGSLAPRLRKGAQVVAFSSSGTMGCGHSSASVQAAPAEEHSKAQPGLPRPVVLCGPSGVGKSTLVKRLQADFPDDFGFSVSHTTRDSRPGEVDGVDYHFTSIQEIEEAIGAGGFLEHAKVHGNYYGTSKAAVADVQRDGRICILDIDVQGVQQVQDQHFEVSKYIFIEPPSVEDLEHRLRKRGTETEKRIRKRVGAAAGEIEASKSLHWDARIVNNTIEEAYAELRAATEEERERAAIARGLTVATELQGLPRA